MVLFKTLIMSLWGEIHTILAYSVSTKKHKWNELHATSQSQQQNIYLLLVLLEFYLQCQYGQPQHSSTCLDLNCAPAKKTEKELFPCWELQRCTLCSTCVCQGVFQGAVKAAFSNPTLSSPAFLELQFSSLTNQF